MKYIIPTLYKILDFVAVNLLPVALELAIKFRQRVLRRHWRFEDSPRLAAELLYLIRFMPSGDSWADAGQLRQSLPVAWSPRRFNQIMRLGIERGLVEREQYRAGDGRLASRCRLTAQGKRYLP